MTAEIKGMIRLAARVGHHTPAGHMANTGAALLSIVPEHQRHADRQLWILTDLTSDLERALSSHNPGGAA